MVLACLSTIDLKRETEPNHTIKQFSSHTLLPEPVACTTQHSSKAAEVHDVSELEADSGHTQFAARA